MIPACRRCGRLYLGACDWCLMVKLAAFFVLLFVCTLFPTLVIVLEHYE